MMYFTYDTKPENEVEGTVADPAAPSDSERGVITYDLPKIELPVKESATVRLLALGRTHKSIAEEFNISPAAVDQRRKRAMNRTGVRTSAGLVHYAIAAGLVELMEAE